MDRIPLGFGPADRQGRSVADFDLFSRQGVDGLVDPLVR